MSNNHNLIRYLKAGTGEISLAEIILLGLELRQLLNTAVHAGLKHQLQLSLTDSTSYKVLLLLLWLG